MIASIYLYMRFVLNCNTSKLFQQFLIIIFLFTSISFSQSHSLKFEHITSDDGLSSNDIRCIIQDYKGFLWIGTQNGVNRYDGINIKIFRNVAGDSSTISSNWINTIFEDKNRNLWIGTRGSGLNLLIRETGKFESWQNIPGDSNSISGNNVWCMFEDSKENLWIGTRGSGLNLIDRKKGIFKRWLNDPLNSKSISHNSITTISEDKEGRLWLGTEGGGINIFDYSSNTFSNWENICNDKSNYPSDFVNTIIKDSKGYIWIGSDNFLTKINSASGKYKHWGATPNSKNGLSSGFISNILEDKNGNFWIATKDAGLNLFNGETEIFSSSKFSINKFSLSSDEILTIYKDKSNILWIGTHGGGINKLKLKNLAFQYWGTDPIPQKGLPQKEVRKLFADKNNILWIGTNDGLSKFDRRKNIFRNYDVTPQILSGSKRNRIRSIYRSNKGVLYVGVEKGGLNEFDEKNDRFISYLPKSKNIEDLSSRNLRSICEDSRGILWLGTYNGGLHRFNPQTHELKRIPINADTSHAEENEQIEIIIKHNENEIWLGTENGLILFNTLTHKTKRWVSEEDNSYSLIDNAIRALYKDEYDDAILWIGTRGGLSRFDIKHENFTNFTINDGLPSDLIYGILRISASDVGIVTSNGLSKLNLENFRFENLSIPFNNNLDVGINSPTNKKEIIVGGKNGLTIFNSDEIQDNMHIPQVVFTEFRKYNEPIKMEKDYSETESLNLKYSDDMFSISFAALDFSNPAGNHYSYKLEGFNHDWIDLKNDNTVTFTNLDPGDYKLFVKASNSDGVWSVHPAVLEISIAPPFWMTIYFRLAVFLLVILAVYWGIKLKTHNIEKQNLKLDKLIKLRTSELESEIRERKNVEIRLQKMNASKDKFFSIISHDLRSPFTAITGLTDLLISEFPTFTKEEIRENLSTIDKSSKRVYNLLENLLDWSSIQTGRIIFTPKYFNLNIIINEVIRLFEANLKNKKLNIIYDHDKNQTVFADYDMTYTIIRNLVSNAIKFTRENGEIEIRLEKENEYILASTRDSGIGIEKCDLDKLFRIDIQQTTEGTKHEKGTGLGLILCKELVETNTGKIWVESEKGIGTTFIFTLPTSEKHS